MSRPKVIRAANGELMVERFSPPRRFEHLLVIASFVALVVTGLPQKFDHSGLGHWMLTVLGGLDNARFVHRVAGIVFCIHGFVHILAIVIGVLIKRMELTLLPTPQDLWDSLENLRFYLGQRKHPPAMPKFDYRQKFEYMGMVLGGFVMIGSGLVLMYPVLVAEWLPGQLILAAKLMHSSEALLALLVLVVWHVYGSHLSPDVFPMDTSIFTGYMSAKDLKHHHVLEYKRIFGESSMDEHEHGPDAAHRPATVPPPSREGSAS